MAKNEDLHDRITGTQAVMILGYFMLILIFMLGTHKINNLQEEIDSMPHYDCRIETVSGSINESDIAECYFESFSGGTICSGAEKINGRYVTSEDYKCLDGQCIYSYEEETCELVRNSKQGGKA